MTTRHEIAYAIIAVTLIIAGVLIQNARRKRIGRMRRLGYRRHRRRSRGTRKLPRLL